MNIVDNGIKEFEIPKPYTSPGIEYYIGFGSGYEQGQKMRFFLQNDTTCKMLLNEKIECFSFLLEKQETCNLYLDQLFLDNIKYWEDFNISLSIKNNIIDLVNENKTQRAIDTLFLFLKDHFYLKHLMSFYTIYQKLKQIRLEKKKNNKKRIKEEIEKIKIGSINKTTHNIGFISLLRSVHFTKNLRLFKYLSFFTIFGHNLATKPNPKTLCVIKKQ